MVGTSKVTNDFGTITKLHAGTQCIRWTILCICNILIYMSVYVCIRNRMSHYVIAFFFKYTATVKRNKTHHYKGVIIVFDIWKIQNITWHPHERHTYFKRTYRVSIYAHILQSAGVKVRFQRTAILQCYN